MTYCQQSLTGLLAVAWILSPALGNSKAPGPIGAELLNCQFDESWDKNYDDWPDDWERKVAVDYPNYVRIEIVDDATSTKGRSLAVRLDGGSAYFHSPEVPVSSLFSYVLSARMRVENVQHARISLGVAWRDAQGEPVGEPTLGRVISSPGWHEVRIGPLSPSEPQAEHAVVFVQIERGKQIDLDGVVFLDDVRVYRIPQVVLEPARPLGLFEDPEQVLVRCRLTGVSSPHLQIRFDLRSVEGELLEEDQIPIELTPVSTLRNGPPAGAHPRHAEFQGMAQWRPKHVEYGFYRVHATLMADGTEGEERYTSLAVLRPLPQAERGMFGWSLDSVTDPLSTDDWSRLLTQVGIHWVKLPVWYDVNVRDLGDELVHFTERLATFGIEVVGVIDRPPQVREDAAKLAAASSIAEVLSLDTSYWLPSLDPIMTRLSLRIRWWQFGGDRDTSFVGYPDLASLIQQVHGKLYRFGQKVRVGIPWKWMAELPAEHDLPWQFVQWSADPPLTGGELAASLEDEAQVPTQSWVLIDPPLRDLYPLSHRVADLIQKMISARVHGADAAFLPYPVDSSRGVLDDRGAPDELFLPFRTAAMLLADAEYLGSMRLPSGSQNHAFRTPGGMTFMVVWNGGPTNEELFLGEDILHIDPWGRELPVGGDANLQSIGVSELPTFVLNLNGPVTRIRIDAAFERTSIPSVLGKPQLNALTFVNAFPQGVAGVIKPTSSTSWEFGPERFSFKAAARAEVRIPFEIKPLPNASSGRQQVRLDFEVQAARTYAFSIWRQIDVGLGEIDIEVSTVLERDGTLVVEQRTVNHTDELVDFKCLLYAPDRRRQRNHVFRLGRGQDIQYYRFSDAHDLVGEELWLRAEEIGGQRVLNYRFRVEQ